MSRSMSEMQGKKSTAERVEVTRKSAHQIKDRILGFLKEEVWPVWLQGLKGLDVSYCLAIDSNTLRLVKIEKKKGRLCGLTSESEPIRKSHPDQIENLSRAIESLLLRIRYLGEEISVGFFSDHDVLNKMVKIESEDTRSTQEWIIANRQKIFPPVDDEEMAFDYGMIYEDDKKRSVFFCICRREKIKRLLDVFQKFRLAVKKISPVAIGVYRTLEKRNILIDDEDLAVVLLGDASAELFLYQGRSPVFITQVRHALRSANSACGDELFDRHADEFAANLASSVDLYYGKTEAAKDLKFLILGEDGLAQRLEGVLEGSGMSLTNLSARLEKEASASRESASLSRLLALSCQPARASQTSEITFLPASWSRRFVSLKSLRKGFAYGLKAMLLLLLTFGLLDLGFLVYELGNREKMRSFESKMETLNDLIERNEILADRLGGMESVQASGSRTSQLLFVLSEIMPKEIWLRDVSARESEEGWLAFSSKIDIAGLSASEKAVTELLANLEKSPGLSDVQMEYLDKVPAGMIAKVPGNYVKSVFKFKIGFLRGL